MTSCSPNNFYLVTNISNEENSCYPISSLTGNYWYRSLISVHMHHAYHDIAQNILVYSTLTHPAGRQAIFYNYVRVSGHRDSTELFIFWWNFSPSIFVTFSLPTFGAFSVVFSLHILMFSLILKVFNIGQEKAYFELYLRLPVSGIVWYKRKLIYLDNSQTVILHKTNLDQIQPNTLSTC